MSEPHTILHVDMDSFFAAVEQLDDPSLRGKPVLVGGDGPRAVVATASYEARRFGCHSAQPMSVARRLCPQAIVVTPRGSRYAEISRQVFALLDHLSPLVEPISIDEAFVDLTGTRRLLGDPADIARQLKADIQITTGLTASVGVAPNKFLAKLASELDKPDGLRILDARDVDTVLPALPISRLWGVGPATAAKLEAMRITTFGDLRAAGPDRMSRQLGDHGRHLWRLAMGRDDRTVTPDHAAKSISQEQTFAADVGEIDTLRGVLLGQTEHVAWRLRRAGRLASGLTLKIRDGEFHTLSRSTTLDPPTDRTDALWAAARAGFDRWAGQAFHPLRLLGMGVGPLTDGKAQLDLFSDAAADRSRQVDLATDQIKQRFGKAAIQRGATLRRHTPPR